MSSDADSTDFSQERMIRHFVDAERWDRVLETGPQLLASEPENTYVHSMMALSALEVDDLALAKRHVNATIRLAPEDPGSHLIQSRYFARRGRILYAKKSLEEALRLDPENSAIWCEFGWNCLYRGDVRSAREACDQARSLAPNNASLENLAASIDGASEDSDRISAYEKIEAYQASLRFDPDNVATFYNIGHTYLEDLDDGKNARHWFQQAAALDPLDRDIHRALLKSIRRCDPVLRVINWPWNISRRAANFGEEFSAKRPVLSYSLVLFLFPVGIFFLILLSMWAVFLYLPGKLYEWMTAAEASRKASDGSVRVSGIYRIPLWIRLTLCFVLNLGFISAMWLFFTHPEAKNYHDTVIGGGMIVGIIIGVWISAVRKA